MMRSVENLDSTGSRRDGAGVPGNGVGQARQPGGSRLVFVLGQIGKVLELTEIERRLVALEHRSDG